MSETTETSRDEHRSGPLRSTASRPVEIEAPPTDPEKVAIEILLEARRRLRIGASPCAADSERLLARTARHVLEDRRWPEELADPVRAALDRILPAG